MYGRKEVQGKMLGPCHQYLAEFLVSLAGAPLMRSFKTRYVPLRVVSINDHLVSQYHRLQDSHHQNNFVYAEKGFSHLASLL